MFGFFNVSYRYMKNLLVAVFIFSFMLTGCFLQKPQKVEKEYYDDGRLKQVRKYYKKRMTVKYYGMEKKRKKS